MKPKTIKTPTTKRWVRIWEEYTEADAVAVASELQKQFPSLRFKTGKPTTISLGGFQCPSTPVLGLMSYQHPNKETEVVLLWIKTFATQEWRCERRKIEGNDPFEEERKNITCGT